MRVARIVAPFGLSGLVFVLAYLSSKDSGSGLFPVMLLLVGIVLAVVGIAVLFSDRRGE